MKVKTLLNCMMYSADEAELYTSSMVLVSKMSIDTLRVCYGDYLLKKFHTYEDDDGLTVLEIVLV